VKIAVCCKPRVAAIKSEKVEPTGEQKRTTRHGLFLNEVGLGGTLSSFLPAFDMGWLPAQHQTGLPGRTISPTVYLGLVTPVHRLATLRCGYIKDDRRHKQRPSGVCPPVSALRGYRRHAWFVPRMIETLRLSIE
jgi:hypothetical protein